MLCTIGEIRMGTSTLLHSCRGAVAEDQAGAGSGNRADILEAEQAHRLKCCRTLTGKNLFLRFLVQGAVEALQSSPGVVVDLQAVKVRCFAQHSKLWGDLSDEVQSKYRAAAKAEPSARCKKIQSQQNDFIMHARLAQAREAERLAQDQGHVVTVRAAQFSRDDLEFIAADMNSGVSWLQIESAIQDAMAPPAMPDLRDREYSADLVCEVAEQKEKDKWFELPQTTC